MKFRFIHSSETWYWPSTRRALIRENVVDDVQIHVLNDAGEFLVEFSVAWHDLGRMTAPRLEVFEEAWGALFGPEMQAFRDLLFSSKWGGTPAGFCTRLKRDLGWTDATERVPS